LFAPGSLVITAQARDLILQGKLDPVSYLLRHLGGDWGDMCERDFRDNDLALNRGQDLLSRYRISPTDRIWVETRGSRRTTTLSLGHAA
jgi:hypothetical protein